MLNCSIHLYHHLGWEIISNKISFNIKDRQIPTKVKAPGYVRRLDWDNTDFHELHSHFASITHGCLFRNALAWEEYWRWDEDDTNVAVYYNTKDKPCGFMVYLIKNDIMHIKETIRPYAMGRIIDIESFLQDYPCDPDGGTLYVELEIEDHLLLWNNRSFRLCFSDGTCMLTDEPAEYKLKMEHSC